MFGEGADVIEANLDAESRGLVHPHGSKIGCRASRLAACANMVKNNSFFREKRCFAISFAGSKGRDYESLRGNFREIKLPSNSQNL